ncbi:uncharacterized protein LOC123867017 isoform X2 [Maniola jurtina]|uniref:uncharacterized protein LOC123867017 isoform X2 n=1 Tax=Maniola jurtina TaxID=191418 RepID=UPI001E68BC56|nr:uncharacterized protein LOC123867017 isoform X2 [Maniola jurtina]
MDNEQTALPQPSPTLSVKEPSLQSQKILPISPSPQPLVASQTPKLPSIVSSPIRTSPFNTSSASPAKSSNQISLKSQETIKERPQEKSSVTEETKVTKKSSSNSKDEKHDVKVKDTVEDNLSTNIVDLSTPVLQSNIDKIANMSKVLTNEANSLRKSIKSLSEDIDRTKQELSFVKEENVNFPYHLFLIEIIVNKIFMKCECCELDCSNLVIAATFLGKQPITLYDPSYGKIDDFTNINVGKSALFAMTYDKICSVKEFVINLQINKQPPCSNCVTKIAESKIDYTQEFLKLREELCKKWTEEQPNDNIMCTTSTPLASNMFYLSCGGINHSDSIGIIELTTRMSFLGKEITTAFSTRSKPKCTTLLTKEDNGMTMYSCQNVEMDREGKILLDESSFNNKKEISRSPHILSERRSDSPTSQFSSGRGSVKQYDTNYKYHYNQDYGSKYDEIFTKMNANELKIRVPKSTKLERTGKYDKIQELCICEDNPHNTGDQIQFELPRDLCYPDKSHTYTSNLKYTYKGYNKIGENKERKIINVTPSNCPIPVNIEKQINNNKDVFILKIGKKLETKDKKTDLEIELVTPKAPSAIPIENSHIAQQCSSSILKDKPLKAHKKKSKKKENKTGLGEFRIRDLNDEINKLMREKRHWEVQIKALGGPDHARVGPKMLDQDGKEVPGNRGYKYFGAAKDLPGVRELFSQEPPAAPRRTRADLMRDVDADYYGYRDDDDGLLLPLERDAERDSIARAVDEWKRNKEENKDQDVPEEENIYPEDPNDKRIEDEEDISESTVTSHVAVPSQKDVEEALLRRKKQELLERYGCLDVKMEES